MTQRVYATLADYEDFTDGDHEPASEDVTNATLRRASIVIDGLTRTSVYEVDEDGYPTDVDVAEAFKDATCAQMSYWDITDDVTGAESQMGPTRIGSVSFGGSGASGNAQNGKSPASSRVSPEAIEILRNAGLIRTAIAHT